MLNDTPRAQTVPPTPVPKTQRKEKQNHNGDEKRIRPEQTSGFVHHVINFLAQCIQWIVFILMEKSPEKITIDRELRKIYRSDAKFRWTLYKLIVEKFEKISVGNTIMNLFNCKVKYTSISLMAYIVANTFDILYCTSGSFFSALFTSLMILFDEAMVSLVYGDTIFGVQLFLVTCSIRCAQKLQLNQAFSLSWVGNVLFGVSTIVYAIYIRLEVIPFALPIIIAITLSMLETERKGFFSRIFSTIGASMVLMITTGLCFITIVIVVCGFGLPRYELWSNIEKADTMKLCIVEVFKNPHNIAIFCLVPLASGLAKLGHINWKWVLPLAGAFISIIFLPFTCVADDLRVKVVLATYALILTCGTILCSSIVSWISPLALAPVLLLAVYLYVRPVQRDF